MIRVAVIDDHMVVRAGIKYMIESAADMEFAGEFGGGVGAADFVMRTLPDVTLLDVKMPERDGIAVLQDILARDARARVVMLTTSDSEEDVYQSVEHGALGYVMKDSPIDEILEAIRAARRGEVTMSDEVRRLYETRQGMKGLSPREKQVIACAAEGLGNREIGEKLGISENSVKMHLKRIYFKLSAADRAEAVIIAQRRGMLA